MQLFNLYPVRMLAESSAPQTYLYQLGTLFFIPHHVGTNLPMKQRGRPWGRCLTVRKPKLSMNELQPIEE